MNVTVGSVRARQLVYEFVGSVRARQLVYEFVGSVRARQLVYECHGWQCEGPAISVWICWQLRVMHVILRVWDRPGEITMCMDTLLLLLLLVIAFI